MMKLREKSKHCMIDRLGLEAPTELLKVGSFKAVAQNKKVVLRKKDEDVK